MTKENTKHFVRNDSKMQVLSHACNLKSGLRRLKEETATKLPPSLMPVLAPVWAHVKKKQKGKMKKRNKDRGENS